MNAHSITISVTFLVVYGCMVRAFTIPSFSKIHFNSFNSFIKQQKTFKYSSDDMTSDITSNSAQSNLKLGVLLLNLGGPTKKEVIICFPLCI